MTVKEALQQNLCVVPQSEGYYLWYILDLGYLNVGLVQVLKDNAKHLETLKAFPPERQKGYYIYQNDAGETLTMYHQANGGGTPHLPPLFPDNKPAVDGYAPFDLEKDLWSKELK